MAKTSSITQYAIPSTRNERRATTFRRSTSVKIPRQINLFMQNEPNFLNSSIHPSHYAQRTYTKIHPSQHSQKRTQTNPIKANLQNTKISLNLYPIKAYENEGDFTKSNKRTQFKANQTQFKPNTNPKQTQSSEAQ